MTAALPLVTAAAISQMRCITLLGVSSTCARSSWACDDRLLAGGERGRSGAGPYLLPDVAEEGVELAGRVVGTPRRSARSGRTRHRGAPPVSSSRWPSTTGWPPLFSRARPASCAARMPSPMMSHDSGRCIASSLVQPNISRRGGVPLRDEPGPVHADEGVAGGGDDGVEPVVRLAGLGDVLDLGDVVERLPAVAPDEADRQPYPDVPALGVAVALLQGVLVDLLPEQPAISARSASRSSGWVRLWKVRVSSSGSE